MKSWFQTLLTLIILLGITTAIFLYTSGYRLQKDTKTETIDFTKTGMISAKSMPEGASVYLDDKLMTATNDTIPGIEPGTHKLKITKKGYGEWTKDIEVFAELVTDITAILVSQSPRLEPLTNTGASNPSVSPSLANLAYFSKDETTPGVWVMPVNQGGINIFRSTPTVVLEDTQVNKYSDGKSITWSPDEIQLIVETSSGVFYLVDLQTNSAQSLLNPQTIKDRWNEILTTKRQDFIDKLEISEEIKTLALSKNVIWSPDEKKFLYTEQSGNDLVYKVYNMEKPLPVGEKVDTVAFTKPANEQQPTISWYSDSYHLLLTENYDETNHSGVISMIRIDGTNKIELYSNPIFSSNVYSVPSGDKVIVLTSVKSNGQTDLYTIGLR